MHMIKTWVPVFFLGVCIAGSGCSDTADEQGDAGAGPDSLGADDVTSNNRGGKDDSGDVRFPGSGDSGSGDALEPGVSPETADDCGSGTPASTASTSVIEQETECFYSEEDGDKPAAAIEQIVEVVDDETWIHLRLTLDPRFVDNSYGETAVGWENKKKGHTFKDLVGSDHAEMMMYDKEDALVLQFKLDYISEDSNSASGYGTLGVTGGDGKMIVGEESAILGAATSLDRNLNGCGLSEYTTSSPVTDARYSLPDGAEAWDYRVVYEVWVDATVFGDAGFGRAEIENVHASPSKIDDNTVTVIPGECPPCDPKVEICDPWDDPCDPTVEDCGRDTDEPDTDGPDTEDRDTDDRDSSVVV